MIIPEKTVKAIKIILIIIIVIIVVIIILAEIDRQRNRNVPCPVSMYYGGGHWITAPFNLLTAVSLEKFSYSDPFPSLEKGFPDHNRLRKHWRTIKDEVLDIYNKGSMKEIKGDMFFQKIADDKWKKFYIKWYGDSLTDANKKLPFTTQLIDSFPEIKLAMISVLEPGSKITPHVGPLRAPLRYHLGLQTPKDKENCWIKVDGIKYSWEDGEGVLFDDTYVHEVQNNTDEIRIILFCDIQIDLGNEFSNTVNDFVCQMAKVTAVGRK